MPSAASFPWETRITPPPPRKKVSDAEAGETALAERMAAAIAAEAARREAAAKSSIAKAKEDQIAKKKAAAKAREAENAALIEEAVRVAVTAAAVMAPKTFEELAKLHQDQCAKAQALMNMLTKVQEAKGSTLKLKLGQAIMKRNITTPALMREWDANGDGDLTKTEFAQAVQRTLKLEASQEQIKELFDEFDNDRSGSLTINECAPPSMPLTPTHPSRKACRSTD